jgi:beta-lactamase class A
MSFRLRFINQGIQKRTVIAGFLLVTVLLSLPGIAQTFKKPAKDKRLEMEIRQLLTGFEGQVGVYVKNLKTGKVAAVNADTIFPTASMIKVPILVGIMDKIDKGQLHYHDELLYRDSLLYAGPDVLGSFKQDEKIELGRLIMLMLTLSDNTASLWLQTLAGTGERINELLDGLSLKSTRVNSRTPGREEYRTTYGWGQTTPAEMATLIEKIYLGQVINKQSSETMLRLLGRNYYDDHAIAAIPPYIFVASKNGAVDQSRSETLLVMAPHGPYVFSIITKNQKDQSWEPTNAGWLLAKNVSALLWKHFEPNSNWNKLTIMDKR